MHFSKHKRQIVSLFSFSNSLRFLKCYLSFAPTTLLSFATEPRLAVGIKSLVSRGSRNVRLGLAMEPRRGLHLLRHGLRLRRREWGNMALTELNSIELNWVGALPSSFQLSSCTNINFGRFLFCIQFTAVRPIVECFKFLASATKGLIIFAPNKRQWQVNWQARDGLY